MRLTSRPAWRKLAVLLAAVAGFVFLYETRMLDSTYATWQSMLREDGHPAPGERLQFTATAYCKGTTTASGVNATTGIAAADPAILPVGSVINVATGDPRYNGVYTVMDTGPRVQGRTLDLYLWSCHEALRFGRKQVQVTLLRLGWDPRASSPGLIDRLFRGREARRVPPPEPPPPAGIPQNGDGSGSDATVEPAPPGMPASDGAETRPAGAPAPDSQP